MLFFYHPVEIVNTTGFVCFSHNLISPIVPLSFQKKVSFEPVTSYLLKNLKPFSTYTFQLAAKSKHGIGAYTNEVSIDTPQTRRSNHKYSCVCVSA